MRTWALKGKTPIIQFHFNWTHILVIAGLSRTNCMFRLHADSIKKEQHGEFLKTLRAYLKQRLLIIWDGLKAHRSRLMRDYLDSTGGDIQMALLPPYSPDLNPVEFLWAWLKRHALANFCPANLDELNITARAKLEKRPTTAVDHRSALGSGRLVVMSPFREISIGSLLHGYRCPESFIYGPASDLPSNTRGRSPVRELRTLGFVRGGRPAMGVPTAIIPTAVDGIGILGG